MSLNEYNVNSDPDEIFSVKTIVTQGSCRIFPKAFMLLYTKSYHVYLNVISKLQLSSSETSEVEVPFILQRPHLTRRCPGSLPTLDTNSFDKLKYHFYTATYKLIETEFRVIWNTLSQTVARIPLPLRKSLLTGT